MRDEKRPVQSPSAIAPQTSVQRNGSSPDVEKFIQKVRSHMWQNVAVVREGKMLRQTLADLTAMQFSAAKASDRRAHEAANILQTGILITRSALAREESRGAHYRLDYPIKNDRKFAKHSVIRGDVVSFQ
jgi:L-aspartate oxidase